MSAIFGPQENFRVIVNVESYGISVAAAKREADEICTQIKRHVDCGKGAYVAYDMPKICSFCGALWTEDDNDYNGGCCDNDQHAHELQEGAT